MVVALGALVVSMPVRGETPPGVEVNVEQVTRPMLVAPPNPGRPFYPAKVEKEKLKPFRDATKAAKEAAGDGYLTDPAFLEAKAAYDKAKRSNWTTVDWTGPLVTLDNGLLRVELVPTLGARVLNAIDLTTGRSLAGTPDPQQYTADTFQDIIGWTAGYIELSFPYFEHGTRVRQPAGYRVIEHDDGSVTVAMDMRFSQYQDAKHTARYGQYSQRIASVWVTLKPGEARYTTTFRIDNPNPLRRSQRAWVNILLHADKYDGDHILYPVGYVTGHNASYLAPFFAEGGKQNYVNVSHFGLYPDYDFMGTYDPKHDTNALIITDEHSPGMKLYTPNAPGGFFELWTGSGVVFEDPADFLPGFVPTQFTLTHYAAGGIGRVAFANQDVAIGLGQKTIKITSPLGVNGLDVFGSDGKPAAYYDGPPPGQIVVGMPKDQRVIVKRDGQIVADVTFPLAHTDTRKHHPKVKQLGGKFQLELEEITNHRGAPRVQDALGAANKLLKAGQADDTERVQSLANACYRLGHFDTTLALLDLIDGGEDEAYVRGLIAWERGEQPDFSNAGVQANYHLALIDLQKRNAAKAVAKLDKLIEAQPKAYRPRLLRAYLAKDAEAAAVLSAENPASPEALLVCKLLGDEAAGAAIKQLCDGNPEAAADLKRFEAELTTGRWEHTPRFAPLLPKE